MDSCLGGNDEFISVASELFGRPAQPERSSYFCTAKASRNIDVMKSLLYGSDNPTRTTLLIYNTIYSLMGLWVYGWQADFVPSQAWASMGFHLSIILTIIASLAFYMAVFNARLKLQAEISPLKKLTALSAVPILIFFLLSISVTHGMGDIATRIAGQGRSIHAELFKEHHLGGKACDHRLEGRLLEAAIPSYVCITEQEFKHYAKEARYTMDIKETFMGFHIYSIAPAPNH